MRTLHIAPGDSAGGSLQTAIRHTGRNEEVLRNRDDLSCGPIASEEPSARAAWWGRFYDMSEVESELKAFWDRIAATDDRLVVWFGRHSASELAFFQAFVDRLGDRAYDIVDVTNLPWPSTPTDGSTTTIHPAKVGIMQPDRLASLIETARPIANRERDDARSQWHRLRSENAPFRVVTPDGLESAPIDHFDHLLLKQATPEWRKVARVIGDTIGYNSEPYWQANDLMLLTRIVALVGAGKLLADGDPWEMHACRVRLPN